MKKEKDGASAVQNGANYDPLANAVARSATQLVELPGFGDGEPWQAYLKRVSLLSLARAGRIPNALMQAVTELYQRGTTSTASLTQAAEVMYLVAGEALASPTLAQLEEAGVVLSDQQLTAIYLYAQRGVEALRPFRKKPAVSRDGEDGKAVSAAAQPDAGHP